jgi:hypothetical protein
MIVLGFTGSREMRTVTPDRLTKLTSYVGELSPGLAVHGGCDGWDMVFQGVCKNLGIPFEVYPSTLQVDKGQWEGAQHIYSPLPPLERNRHIVGLSTHMVACPKYPEITRSGTWSTIRFTKMRGKPLKVIE